MKEGRHQGTHRPVAAQNVRRYTLGRFGSMFLTFLTPNLQKIFQYEPVAIPLIAFPCFKIKGSTFLLGSAVRIGLVSYIFQEGAPRSPQSPARPPSFRTCRALARIQVTRVALLSSWICLGAKHVDAQWVEWPAEGGQLEVTWSNNKAAGSTEEPRSLVCSNNLGPWQLEGLWTKPGWFSMEIPEAGWAESKWPLYNYI